MYKRSLVILTILIFLLSACSAAKSPDLGAPQAQQPESARESTGSSEPGKALDNSFSGQVNPLAVDRLVVKNATLTIVVSDPVATMDVIAAMAESMGGFVVTSNAYKTQTENGIEVPQASITVRVPVGRLNEAVRTIKDQTANPKEDVLTDQVSGEDVTQQYTDLQSRLRNLVNAEAQLQEIMGSAKDTQDVLATYNQLVSVQEQIEVLRGQIQYYEQAAALSAINVSLLAKESVQPLSIGGWQPVGTARDAVQTLVDTLKFLGNAIIWVLLYVAPVVILLYLIVFLPLRLLLRYLRRNRPARQPKMTVPPAPPAAQG